MNNAMKHETKEPPGLPSEFLTVNDVALLLKVSKNTVYRLAETHKLVYYRITPRILRFRRKDLDAFLEAQPDALTPQVCPHDE